MIVRQACLLFLVVSVVMAQFDSTIPSDYDEELEDSTTHIPKFISKSIRVDAKEGDTVTFPCEVDDLGPFSIVWKHGKSHIFADQIRLMSDKNFVRMDNNSLQIRKLRGNYSGQYICVISHTPVLELTHYLTVMVRPRIQILPKTTIVVKQGQNLEANCNATGSPTPTVAWKRLDGVSAGTIRNGAILRISSVDRMDSGAYECIAENGVGDPATAVLRVQVMHAPEIELKANWVHSGVGHTTDLECTVFAEPAAHVTWYTANGRTIKSDQHFTTKSIGKLQHSLRIRKATKDDFGEYTCMATNPIGTTSAVIEVSGLATPVHFKSDPNGDKPDSFILTWETNSYAKVVEYLMKLRIQEENSEKPTVWTEVNIPAESQTGVLHTHTYEATGLQVATTYEAIMTVRNEFGWNNPSESFFFSTQGKAVVPILLEDSSVLAVEDGEISSTASEALRNGSTPIPTTPRTDAQIIHMEAHPHPMQADNNNGNNADSPKKVRVFSLLTVIILSFFF